MVHRHVLRVYIEDTDLAGVVYYANYLKYIERARCEWLRQLGIDQAALKAETGRFFVVRRVEAEYHHPACFDNVLTVTTELAHVRGARVILEQRVMRGDLLMFSAGVTVACLNAKIRPTRLPSALLLALKDYV